MQPASTNYLINALWPILQQQQKKEYGRVSPLNESLNYYDHNASDCTLPAGANSELSFNLGGVERVILCDQEGLEGSSIHKQRHCRELDVQHIVMPFLITDLQANSRPCTS